MGNFEPAFSKEMIDQLVVDMYEHVKAGTLSELKDMGVAKECIAKRDDEDNLVYYDIRFPDEQREINLNTMIGRVREIRKNWKKYFAPKMEALMLEAMYQHALKAGTYVSSFKAASEMIMPKEDADDGNKPALSPGVSAILQQNPVGTTIVIGQDSNAKRTGDKGHARADRVHPLAHGHREDTPAETVSSGHDKPIHGVSEGDDTPQRNSISNTEVSPEDTVDNDSGDNMGAA